MTWDLSDGQNIRKKILEKELSSKISTKVLYKVNNMVKCFVSLLLLLWGIPWVLFLLCMVTRRENVHTATKQQSTLPYHRLFITLLY